MTDDEERRTRRSEALAAARSAGRDDDRREEADDQQNDRPEGDGGQQSGRRERVDDRRRGDRETDRAPESRGARRHHEGEPNRQRGDGRRQGGNGPREGNEQRDGSERRDTTGRSDGSERRDEDEQQSGGRTGVERVSAVDHDAALVTAFEHDGYDCELGRVGDDFFGFVRVPPDHDRLHLMWELDVPGEFGYGPDADGWVGFDTRPVDRELSPREAAMALAGLAAQVAERSRSTPN